MKLKLLGTKPIGKGRHEPTHGTAETDWGNAKFFGMVAHVDSVKHPIPDFSDN